MGHRDHSLSLPLPFSKPLGVETAPETPILVDTVISLT
jgi:hypothetical protein